MVAKRVRHPRASTGAHIARPQGHPRHAPGDPQGALRALWGVVSIPSLARAHWNHWAFRLDVAQGVARPPFGTPQRTRARAVKTRALACSFRGYGGKARATVDRYRLIFLQ